MRSFGSMPKDVVADSDSGPRPSVFNRRAALKRGAVIGGAVAWAVPAIQVISMTAASAETPSGTPPDNPPSNTPPGNTPPGNTPPKSPPTRQSPPVDPGTKASRTTGTGGAVEASGGGTLAYTGLPGVPMALTAAGLIAAGTAATVAGKKRVREEPAED